MTKENDYFNSLDYLIDELFSISASLSQRIHQEFDNLDNEEMVMLVKNLSSISGKLRNNKQGMQLFKDKRYILKSKVSEIIEEAKIMVLQKDEDAGDKLVLDVRLFNELLEDLKSKLNK